MEKAKEYVSIVLKALRDASKVDVNAKAMLEGILRNAPIEVVVKRLNTYNDSIKIVVENIVKYYNKYKEEGKI
ncbi:MAG: hypothetical protein DRN17_03445 [Thermoplasmata archaeon]|nr:MAG: hypothetical protein DRN17_03445 [Thermoplasmata archaeon]